MSREGGILRPIICIILIAAGLLSLLAILSFDPDDLPFYAADANRPVHNWSGVLGAYWAGFLFFWVGLGAYVLVVMWLAWALLSLTRKEISDPWTRLGGVVIFLVTICAVLSLPEAALRYGYGPSLGGAMGLGASALLKHFFGLRGSLILLAALTVLSAILATDVLFYELVLGGGRWVLRFVRERRDFARKPVMVKSSRAGSKPSLPEPEPEQPEPIKEHPPVEVRAPGPEPPTPPPRVKPPAEVPLIPFEPPSEIDGYEFPSIDLLDPPEPYDLEDSEETARQNAEILETTLKHFGITARVVRVERGPVVTLFELELAPGIKVNRVISLADDLAIALRAAAVRVVAPIPGKSTIGIEVPNIHKAIVRLRELLERSGDWVNKSAIPLLLGKDISGVSLSADLADMPHLLIAGTTGSGKSVCLNSIIVTLLMTRSPRDVKLLLVDPKMVELAPFQGIPHLLMPIVTDLKRAAMALNWAAKEMDRRYDLLAMLGVRDIKQYNLLGTEGIRERLAADIEDGAELDDVPMHLPHVIVIVDELADLMMSSPKEVEYAITRLAQKSRAVGVHIIVATQRPSVDVVTGLIKANMPGRIAFQVSAKTDSRIILDQNGAERLLGRGDMLFMGAGTSKLVRAQGTYTSDAEIRRVVEAVRAEEPETRRGEMPAAPSRAVQTAAVHELPISDEELASKDPLYQDAARIVLQSRRGSVSLLQRKLEIGYTRAARLVDMMAEDGIVGGYKGSKAREVIITLDEWEERLKAKQQAAT